LKWIARLAQLPNTDPLLLGGYAWTLTVASPSFEAAAPVISQLLCVTALLLLVAGWFTLARVPSLADYLATLGFCGMSASALISLGHRTLGFGFPTIRLTMGAIVWCLFGISWVRARHLSVTSSHAQPTFVLNSVPAPIDPPSSKWAIGLLGLVSASAIVLYGTPSGDGHGALVTGLIVVASLRLTSAAGAFVSRIEQARAASRRTKSAVGQYRS
jgi:hypothetical protein